MTDRHIFIDTDSVLTGRIAALPATAHRAWMQLVTAATREGDTHFTRDRLRALGVTTAEQHHLRAHRLLTADGAGWRLSDYGWRPGGPTGGA